MTKSPEGKSPKKSKLENGVALASQLLRDRLNKKLAEQKSLQASARGGTAKTNMRNPFQNIAPINASRKTRKGLRPG
jgi:hypothetical protein